ncbi:nucleotidyltransferase domain-containing protein [Thermococcus sp. MAR1]|uniref:nucleotidyltransferase domain-containing protein n=1 Tax=Thermococcus sp. MAR1 TaxID=1638263 RepID=UPI00143B8AE7|nr:nucleotidyltransferase domain-containing protein [Thermococcus sp. MAR1]NJE10423.1 nucleotidyltransferase domain-containing protein [Thermococcus sp. MAR1]
MLEEIRETIAREVEKAGLALVEVILFGSRARGDFREDSDWDILVVIKEPLDRKKYRELWRGIYESLDVPADILIVSEDEFERLKDMKGYIYYYATKEGIKV